MQDSSQPLPRGGALSDDGLMALRREFPRFRIWAEVTGERVRYVARGLYLGTSPYAVVTGDLGELRVALAAGTRWQGVTVPYDTTVPNIARMYNYLLRGKDHYRADQQAADSVLVGFPEVALIARANRDFVTRAVAFVATCGVTQFLDIGAGLPAEPAVHQTAQRVNSAARVAYVDNDRLVITHARALLAGPGVAVVPGDMRDPAAILADPGLRALIDLDRPVCVLLASVLHFLTVAEADATVAAFTAAMAPGSYLILSAGTSTGTDPVLIDRLRAAYSGTSVITSRTAGEIEAWFGELDLIPPGLVNVAAWRPVRQWRWLTAPSARILGGVARKPSAVAATAPGDRR